MVTKVKIPYMFATGLLGKILQKIQEARRPERFTQDFLSTKLGHPGGSAQAIIPLLKKLGFLGSDGVPTELYNQFRNGATQDVAMAKGMKNAFSELFDRKEYVYDLSRNDLTNLVVEITGAAKNDRTTKAVVQTFFALKEFANFEVEDKDVVDPETTSASQPETTSSEPTSAPNIPQGGLPSNAGDVKLQIGYTITLNLPETSDQDVFNAIFRSLKDNLIKN